MPINKEFLNTQATLIKKYEGVAPKGHRPYYVYPDDYKNPTIGHGINLNDDENIKFLKDKGF